MKTCDHVCLPVARSSMELLWNSLLQCATTCGTVHMYTDVAMSSPTQEGRLSLVALQQWQQTIEAAEQQWGSSHPAVGRAWLELARALQATDKDSDRAKHATKKAFDICQILLKQTGTVSANRVPVQPTQCTLCVCWLDLSTECRWFQHCRRFLHVVIIMVAITNKSSERLVTVYSSEKAAAGSFHCLLAYMTNSE